MHTSMYIPAKIVTIIPLRQTLHVITWKKYYMHVPDSINNTHFVIAETGILVKMAMCQATSVSGIRGLSSTPNTSDCKNS